MFHCFNFFIYLPWLQSKIQLGSLKKTPSTGSRHLNLDLQGKYDFLILATVIYFFQTVKTILNFVLEYIYSILFMATHIKESHDLLATHEGQHEIRAGEG